MNNPHQKIHAYCKEEKQKAMNAWATCTISKDRYNYCQAINAWDELEGQLYKHRPVTGDEFEKTKTTALFIISLMVVGDYKYQTIEKIKSLQL